MNNTNLFDFCFVDRTQERVEFKNFFSDKTDKTLWIKGERGVGKTTFFNYLFDDWKDYALCYIDVKEGDNSNEVVENFIMELQKHCKDDFWTVTKKKYKRFYDGNIYKHIKDIASEMVPEISTIVSIIMDVGYTAITASDEKKSTENIITDYIGRIIKDKKLCICIDNFSRCDIKVAEKFFQILKTFVSEESFRSCILTTSDDLAEGSELMLKIQETLPYNSITIKRLDEFKYFRQILNPIFDLNEFMDEDIMHIFRKCDGSPQKLKTLISKLDGRDAIRIDANSKAHIDKKIMRELLQTDEYIHLNENDFDDKKLWVIFSYICMPEVVEIQMLRDFALYVVQEEYTFNEYDENDFRESLRGLLKNNILVYSPGNRKCITHCHDANYNDLKEMLKRAGDMKEIFTTLAYEFLSDRPDCKERQKLMCQHAWEANMENWKNENYEYGESLVKDKLFYDAQKIFVRLEDCLGELDPEQVLTIALNSYETGNFQLAIRELAFIEPNKLESNNARYLYYFYLGKSYNNIGKAADGAIMLENALKEAVVDSKEYVETLNVLHMYYNEIIGKHKYCVEIFEYIRDRYKEMHPNIWAKTMRGCHNFLGDKEAFELLEEAKDVTDDELEKAYIMTTMGFICMKLDDVSHAKELFETACDNIKRLKIHEYSYAANNLALCYMLDGEYAKAREILLEALLWNRTDYGEIVLQNHLLICSYYMGLYKETLSSYEYLYNYMETRKPTGSIINRKTYINLAIACDFVGHLDMKEEFFNRAGRFMKNNTSEWRYYQLVGRPESFLRDKPTARYELTIDFDPWFLVYAHD